MSCTYSNNGTVDISTLAMGVRPLGCWQSTSPFAATSGVAISPLQPPHYPCFRSAHNLAAPHCGGGGRVHPQGLSISSMRSAKSLTLDLSFLISFALATMRSTRAMVNSTSGSNSSLSN
jgi:hypothetical protein